MNEAPLRLTSLSHGGGCGCKIAPAALTEILSSLSGQIVPDELMLGVDTGDDAAVYRLNDDQAVVATTDFFMPVVDDPFDFGRIAAANALSDLYATSATPLMALAVLGMPLDTVPVDMIRAVMAGGESICREAGIPIAGGHSIDSVEPIFGLVAIGVVDPALIKRNDTARDGDALILGKPVGIGVLSAALKQDVLDDEGYREMIDTTTQLNKIGIPLGSMQEIHAITDVTGFGFLGHLLEMCQGSGLTAVVEMSDLPVLDRAGEFARQGLKTGAFERNWESYGRDVMLPDAFPAWQHNLLCDPQTSGGLLVSCAPEAAEEALQRFHDAGFAGAAIVGRMQDGEPRVHVS